MGDFIPADVHIMFYDLSLSLIVDLSLVLVVDSHYHTDESADR